MTITDSKENSKEFTFRGSTDSDIVTDYYNIPTLLFTSSNFNKEIEIQAAEVFTKAFLKDKLQEFCLKSERNIPFDEKIDKYDNELKKSFQIELKNMIKHGYIIEIALNLNYNCKEKISAIAAWGPPGTNKKEFDTEYGKLSRELKDKYLPNADYWHLKFLARNPDDNTKGAVSRVVKPYLKLAKQNRLPVVLEAVNIHSKSVYEYFGFKCYGEFLLGESQISKNDNGEIVEDRNGSGVAQFFMVYNL